MSDKEKKEIAKTEKGDIPETSQQLDTIKKNVGDTLTQFDEERKAMAKADGQPEPDSLAEVWNEAIRQTDTNEMLRTNLMQLQVVFQEMYRDLFKGIDENSKETKELIFRLSRAGTNEDWERYKQLKRIAAEERVDMIKRIESMAKTIKQIQQEYRAGEMAKAQFYHISEVRAQQMFIIAIMRQYITDQTLLNSMSNALISGWQQMGSFAKNEEYNG